MSDRVRMDEGRSTLPVLRSSYIFLAVAAIYESTECI